MHSSGEGERRETRNAKRATSKEKRRTCRKVEPIAYEESADDTDAEEDSGIPGAKKMRLLPSPNAKKHKKAAVPSKSRRKLLFRTTKSTSKKSSKIRAATKMTVGQKFDFENEFRVWDYFFLFSTAF